MPFFSRFKNKGAQPALKSKTTAEAANGTLATPQRPKWGSNWNSKTIVPEEVEELIHTCTAEMKLRAEALDAPFLLLPFRPDSDPSGARTFIRNFFKSNHDGSRQYRGTSLQQELRLTEPIVLCSIMKWCWSRMPGGVVTWPVYEGFQIGEKESGLARNAFETFIPIGADSPARKTIIFDFFDLLAAVAAHGKMNGLGGRKLSRLAGWWAFEHSDGGKGFEGGYASWTAAADATSHLFFAYLRTLSPEAHPSMSLIERIPRSLQALLASTEYPPETPTLMQKSTPRVVMLVNAVSPTPFALLRRAKHFEYRDRDRVLREYSEFEDPVDALTDECKRVLYAISATNSSAARSRHRNVAKADESWSAFQNLGFADMDEKTLQKAPNGVGSSSSKPQSQSIYSEPRSRNADYGRPTTPSWADFLSSGFAEDGVNKTSATLLLPPDKVLPPLGSRAQTPSYIPDENDDVAPGELAAIANVDLDDAFWWVWMISLAGEEPAERKAVFGRCAVIETSIMHGRWLIMEEQVKGASPDPTNGVYIAKKKSFFSFTKRGKLSRKRSTGKPPTSPLPEQVVERVNSATPSKSSLAPDQQSKIKQAAAALKRQDPKDDETPIRRGRHEEVPSTKTNSTLTMGLQSEAVPAMKWTSAYDRNTIRAQYLGDAFAGRGMSREDILGGKASSVNLNADGGSGVASPNPALAPESTYFPRTSSTRDLSALPNGERAAAGAEESDPVPPPVEATISSTAPEVDYEGLGLDKASQYSDKVPVLEAEPSASNAMDKEIAVDEQGSPGLNKLGRKPVPRQDPSHPAFRQASVDEPSTEPQTPTVPQTQTVPQTPTSPQQNPAAIAAQRAMEAANRASPESVKSGHNKLKKQSGGGNTGLKKLFGRKKDNPNRSSVDAAVPGNSLVPPAEQNLARRLSLMRKKGAPTGPAQNGEAVGTHPMASELEGEPVMPDSLGKYEHSTSNVSRPDSQEARHAETEFARFDQGPLDMPSATPQSSQHDILAPQAQRKFNLNAHLAAKGPAPLEPEYHSTPAQVDHAADDVQSEATMEDRPEEILPVQDRWATIRENAARRAARASEDQSSQSRPSQSQRTDDGETSGEETIESRVARIKARVAELTGGMDNGGVRR